MDQSDRMVNHDGDGIEDILMDDLATLTGLFEKETGNGR